MSKHTQTKKNRSSIHNELKQSQLQIPALPSSTWCNCTMYISLLGFCVLKVWGVTINLWHCKYIVYIMQWSLHMAELFFCHLKAKTTEMKFTKHHIDSECKSAYCPEAQNCIQAQRTEPLSSLNQTLKTETAFPVALKVAVKLQHRPQLHSSVCVTAGMPPA